MRTIGMRRALLPFVAMTLTLLAAVGTLLAFGISPAQGAVPNRLHPVPGRKRTCGPHGHGVRARRRLFVAEEAGKVRIVKPDGTLATFLDISSKVDITGERGLLGIAFDPNFATNHYVYLYYTRKATTTTPVHNRVVRVTASGDAAIAGSEVLIFRLNNQSAADHQGGSIDFRPDGKLYISSGDNTTPNNAQSLGNLFGKILRINKDGTIPTDNPFYAKPRATTGPSGLWVCATPSSSPSSPAPAPSSSTTWGSRPGRRSTRARRAPTTAGPSTRGLNPMPSTPLPSTHTGTAAPRPPAARSRGVPSTTLRQCSSRAGMSATISSRTFATDG